MRKIVGKVLYKVFKVFPASDTKLGFLWKKFRSFSCKLYLEKVGINVNIDRNSFIGDKVAIDDYSGVGRNSYISNYVTIGKYVMMGPDCLIYTTNHEFSNVETPMCFQKWQKPKPVNIEDDVWIGGRVIILPGVTIGKGSIIGAGSVVTKNVEPYSIVGGNPAHLLKKRK